MMDNVVDISQPIREQKFRSECLHGKTDQKLPIWSQIQRRATSIRENDSFAEPTNCINAPLVVTHVSVFNWVVSNQASQVSQKNNSSSTYLYCDQVEKERWKVHSKHHMKECCTGGWIILKWVLREFWLAGRIVSRKTASGRFVEIIQSAPCILSLSTANLS
jgi:hypothetical protein